MRAKKSDFCRISSLKDVRRARLANEAARCAAAKRVGCGLSGLFSFERLLAALLGKNASPGFIYATEFILSIFK